jgi:hypothetical protein
MTATNDESRPKAAQHLPTSRADHSTLAIEAAPLYRLMRKVPELAYALRDIGAMIDKELAERGQSFIFKTPRGRIVTPMPENARERAVEIDKRYVALGEALFRSGWMRGQSTLALRREYYEIMGDPFPVAFERQSVWVKRAWYARKHGAKAMRRFEQWAGELKRWIVIAVKPDDTTPDDRADNDPEVMLVTDTGGFKSAYYEPPSPEDVALGNDGDDIEHWMDLLTPAEHRAIERELNGEQQPGVAGRMALSRARRKLYLAMEAQREALKNP